MERKFTLRLTADENEMLQALKKITGEKTDAGTIKHLIANFGNLNSRYVNEIKQNQTLRKKNYETDKKIENFIAAFEALKQK